MIPETPGGNIHGINEYSTMDLLHKTGNQTFMHGGYIPATTQSLESHDTATTKDYTSDVNDAFSSTNDVTHTVESISNGNGNRIPTTGNQQSKSDSTNTTDYQQLETTGNQQVTNEETSTTWYQKFESDAISTDTFQQSSNERMATTGYRQQKSTRHYGREGFNMVVNKFHRILGQPCIVRK